MSSFLIEQTPGDFKAIAVFQKNAELTHVRLKRFCASCAEELPSVERGFDLNLKHASLNATASSDQAAFEMEIAFDAFGDGDVEKSLFHIDCCYELKYRLTPGYAPSEEELRAFHEGNALFHCWPFAREFVQNATQRMGLTVPPIPMFRIQVKRPAIPAPGKVQRDVSSGSKRTSLKRALKKAE